MRITHPFGYQQNGHFRHFVNSSLALQGFTRIFIIFWEQSRRATSLKKLLKVSVQFLKSKLIDFKATEEQLLLI